MLLRPLCLSSLLVIRFLLRISMRLSIERLTYILSYLTVHARLLGPARLRGNGGVCGGMPEPKRETELAMVNPIHAATNRAQQRTAVT